MLHLNTSVLLCLEVFDSTGSGFFVQVSKKKSVFLDLNALSLQISFLFCLFA